jgi:hypothetical protein
VTQALHCISERSLRVRLLPDNLLELDRAVERHVRIAARKLKRTQTPGRGVESPLGDGRQLEEARNQHNTAVTKSPAGLSVSKYSLL